MRKLKVSGAVLLVLALVFAVAELVLRAGVPRNGTTPFRLSEIEGVASELRPGFRTLYKGHEIEINADGLRGPELSGPEEGVRRVALFGDSMTFGNGVALGDTLGVRLAEHLAAGGARAQVLNCGVPGYNADQVSRVVAERVGALAPDTVVYVFFANDVEPTPSWDAIDPTAEIDAFHDFPLRSAFLEWTKSHVKLLLQRLGVKTSRRTHEWSRHEYASGRETFLEALRRMDAACEEIGARFLVASYPFLALPGHDPFTPIYESAHADLRELGIELVDFGGAFSPGEDLTDHWVSAFDMHPDGETHGRVAELLAERLL